MATYGSCETTIDRNRGIVVYKWAWTAQAANGGNEGKVSGVGALAGITGKVIGCSFIPGTGNDQPEDQYDVELNTADDFDVLSGKGANLSQSAGTRTVPVTSDKVPFCIYNETLTPSVSGAGASNTGEIYLFVELFQE
jgi:hypothetical protein